MGVAMLGPRPPLGDCEVMAEFVSAEQLLLGGHRDSGHEAILSSSRELDGDSGSSEGDGVAGGGREASQRLSPSARAETVGTDWRDLRGRPEELGVCVMPSVSDQGRVGEGPTAPLAPAPPTIRV